MLATISPANIHVDETLATLRYACQARRIVNRIRVNESEQDKIIRELKTEIDRLKSLHYEYERKRCNESMEMEKEASQHSQYLANNSNNAMTPRGMEDASNTNNVNIYKAEIESLREQLEERKRELKMAEKSWLERLHEAEQFRKTEIQMLRRRGLALEWNIKEKQACLVNLADDPILSGTLFYILPFGRLRVGKKNYKLKNDPNWNTPDIVLDGPLIGRQHW